MGEGDEAFRRWQQASERFLRSTEQQQRYLSQLTRPRRVEEEGVSNACLKMVEQVAVHNEQSTHKVLVASQQANSKFREVEQNLQGFLSEWQAQNFADCELRSRWSEKRKAHLSAAADNYRAVLSSPSSSACSSPMRGRTPRSHRGMAVVVGSGPSAVSSPSKRSSHSARECFLPRGVDERLPRWQLPGTPRR
mmetsp:Transcript_45429/g.98592  ORF Transcript_45429/g.98592 Transcript_45429/m.98592 type:complete len:193 (+) Transcript_45429:28-606(+)